MTLNDINSSTELMVTDVSVDGSLRQRLYDLGLCPGTKITFIRTAPLADPIQVQIGNYHVVLRKSEAKYVKVEPYVS